MSSKNKKQVKKTDFYAWGKEKYGRLVFWDKDNYLTHVDRHYKIVEEEQVFLDTLSDPDVIYPDLYNDNESCYYKRDVFFDTKENKTYHSQVIIVENPTNHPSPTNQKHVIIKTAMDRDSIPEEGKKTPKFEKNKNEKQN